MGNLNIPYLPFYISRYGKAGMWHGSVLVWERYGTRAWEETFGIWNWAGWLMAFRVRWFPLCIHHAGCECFFSDCFFFHTIRTVLGCPNLERGIDGAYSRLGQWRIYSWATRCIYIAVLSIIYGAAFVKGAWCYGRSKYHCVSVRSMTSPIPSY